MSTVTAVEEPDSTVVLQTRHSRHSESRYQYSTRSQCPNLNQFFLSAKKTDMLHILCSIDVHTHTYISLSVFVYLYVCIYVYTYMYIFCIIIFQNFYIVSFFCFRFCLHVHFLDKVYFPCFPFSIDLRYTLGLYLGPDLFFQILPMITPLTIFNLYLVPDLLYPIVAI